MRNFSTLALSAALPLLAGALFTGAALAAAAAPDLHMTKMAELPIVSMNVYDEKADADAAVDAAFSKAKKSHKRVLIDMGGNWCPDCVVLHNVMLLPAMKKFLDQHYEVVMVDVGKFDRNPQVAARFGYTTRLKGVPTILVVDPQTNKVINADDVFALSNAGHQTPQDLANYLARYAA